MKKITLLFVFGLASMTFLSAQGVVVEQVDDSATNGLIVAFEGNDGVGVYVADDFVLTETTAFGEMDFTGNLSNVPNFQNLLGFNIIIYEDAGGLPSSNPSIVGGGLVELRNIPLTALNLVEDGANNADILEVQITMANGDEQVILEPGTYWISAFPTVDEPFAPGGANRWNWAAGIDGGTGQGPVAPVLIDPFDAFGGGFTTYNDVATLIGAAFPALSLVIRDEGILSVEDNILAENIALFPNPTNGDMTLDFARSFGQANVSITNITGQAVMNVTTEGSTQLETSRLASGIYFAQIATDNASTVIKFVKN